MELIDAIIIGLYLIGICSVGFFYRKYSSSNIEKYFLGGNKTHWFFLAASGSVSNFDITGTMFICSLLFLLGMKSMWVHMMWGVLMGAFFMAFMGKWVRRSEVMTAAEWMKTRFGNDSGGQAARLSYALVAVVTL